MKKLFYSFMLLIGVVVMSSCNKDADTTSIANKGIQSSLSRTEMLNVQKSIVSHFYGAHHRAEYMMSEAEAQKLLSPLVKDGKSVRDQILKAAEVGELKINPEETQQLIDMKDEQLAGLSFAVYVVQDPAVMDDLFGLIDINVGGGKQISSYSKKELIDCLSFAVGLGAISGLYSYVDGTASLITARTAFAMARAFIGRTLGWIGVAYAMYEFADCLHSKHGK